MEKHSDQIVRSSEVLNYKVYNLQDEDLGKVVDLVIDKIDGQVRYVVLSFGGFLGLGDKLFALPWKLFSYSPEKDGFIINIDKEKIKSAPGFDKDSWPEFANTQWAQSINNYYGF